MEPSAHELLCADIQQHLLKPTWTASNWLQIHVPLFQASLRQVKARAIQASVELVETVDCTFDLYAIGPPHNMNARPVIERRVLRSVACAASTKPAREVED